jgi:hypothetical protein
MRRRLLLSLAVLFLLSWALSVLLVRRSLLYAVSPPEAVPVTSREELAKLVGRAVLVEARAERHGHAVFQRYGVTSYYAPVAGYDGELIVRTPNVHRLRDDELRRFTGRLTTFRSTAFSHRVTNELVRAGFRPPAGAYLVADGELPQTFWPMLMLFVPVTLVWCVVLAATGYTFLARPRTGAP